MVQKEKWMHACRDECDLSEAESTCYPQGTFIYPDPEHGLEQNKSPRKGKRIGEWTKRCISFTLSLYFKPLPLLLNTILLLSHVESFFYVFRHLKPTYHMVLCSILLLSGGLVHSLSFMTSDFLLCFLIWGYELNFSRALLVGIHVTSLRGCLFRESPCLFLPRMLQG